MNIKQVILLNGPSSSGKSTLAKELQKNIKENIGDRYDIVSIDDFLNMKVNEVLYEDDVYAVSKQVCNSGLEFLAEADGIIVDHVITSERIFTQFMECFAAYKVILIHITCPLEILKERERKRKDRCIGSAESSNEYLYPTTGYLLTLDTYRMSIEFCAQEIREKMMSTYILTSMFPDGLNGSAEPFKNLITKRKKFAFIASEFEKNHQVTDGYFKQVLNMFYEIGICFQETYVIDDRMEKEEQKKAVEEADAVWLSGGDTLAQYQYLLKYELVHTIKKHTGVVIGMSAGSINLGKTALCTIQQRIYEGLGCVDISVEPHFDIQNVSKELLELSKEHLIYGLCDNSIIVCQNKKVEFIGEVYKIYHGEVHPVGGK